MHISEYDHGNIYNLDPLRDRKLLLNRREIDKLLGMVKENSYTIIPLNVKLKNGLIKLDIGLARGKKLYDKRDVQKLKDAKDKLKELWEKDTNDINRWVWRFSWRNTKDIS